HPHRGAIHHPHHFFCLCLHEGLEDTEDALVHVEWRFLGRGHALPAVDRGAPAAYGRRGLLLLAQGLAPDPRVTGHGAVRRFTAVALGYPNRAGCRGLYSAPVPRLRLQYVADDIAARGPADRQLGRDSREMAWKVPRNRSLVCRRKR